MIDRHMMGGTHTGSALREAYQRLEKPERQDYKKV